MKAGQYFGSLDRMVPKEYTQELKKLQDKVEQVPLSKIKVSFEADNRMKLEDKFSEFDEKAIGAASLAQVHRATLKESGQVVAVKLQYPILRIQFKYDLLVMRQLSKVANRVLKHWGYKGFDFVKYQAHFEKGLLQELDFKQEVINSERLRDFFMGYEGLYLPRMHVLDSTKRCIIMEFVKGYRIDDLQGLEKEFGQASEVTEQLVDIFARMIFLHGHIHCDAHPGNIMIRKNKKGKPEVVLIDHGFYCSTGEKFRSDFCDLWYSLVSLDYESTERIAKEMGVGEYYRYLPLLFTYRTINSTKPIGGKLAPEEKAYFQSETEIDLDRIGMLL